MYLDKLFESTESPMKKVSTRVRESQRHDNKVHVLVVRSVWDSICKSTHLLF